MVFREKLKDGTTKLSGGGITLADVFAAIFPVGCIHLSVVNTNPATQFGGTWVAWGSGRVPVGVDLAQVEFDSVEETGGEKAHVLTIPELPQHNHVIDHGHNATTANDGSHDHLLDRGTGTGSSTLTIPRSVTTIDTSSGAAIANDGLHAHTVTVSNFNGSSANSGGGTAHNNLQPYITCYMWKRTA